MIVSMMQPYFYPYIGYFQLMAQSDIFVFRDDAQYIKRGWINRNRLIDRLGREFWITLPVVAASHRLAINERFYELERKHLRHILGQIESAYLRAAKFDEVLPFVRKILAFGNANVASFNINLLKQIAARLGLTTRFVSASESSNAEGVNGQARVIEILCQMGASHYVNPIGGAELYEARAFGRYGIELGFLKSAIEPRMGRHPYLSIIHTLMTEDDASIRDMLARIQDQVRLTTAACWVAAGSDSKLCCSFADIDWIE